MSGTTGTNGPGAQGTEGAGQGQEPPANGTEGQEPQGQNQQGTGDTDGTGNGTDDANQVDLSTITDPAVRAAVEKIQASATKAQQEAARYRTERNTLATKVTEHERANETAEQAAAREATERQERMEALERENRDLKVGSTIQSAAKDAKAFNPNLVTDMLRAKVTLDDNGQPNNVQDLLRELRASDPYLFKRGTNQDAGQGNGDGERPAATSMNDLIRGQVTARRGGRAQ